MKYSHLPLVYLYLVAFAFLSLGVLGQSQSNTTDAPTEDLTNIDLNSTGNSNDTAKAPEQVPQNNTDTGKPADPKPTEETTDDPVETDVPTEDPTEDDTDPTAEESTTSSPKEDPITTEAPTDVPTITELSTTTTESEVPSNSTTDLPPLPPAQDGQVSTWAVATVSILISFSAIFTCLYFLRKFLIKRRRDDQRKLLRSASSAEGFFYGDGSGEPQSSRFHDSI